MENNSIWKTVERPGYFGKLRDRLVENWNKQYGEGNWKLAYEWGSSIIERPEAIQVYEDAYYEFLKSRRDILDWLINTASNVYDTAESNIEAKFDYNYQETRSSHIHDIAIRRSVMRLGKCFKGDRLVHIRSKDTEGYILSPMNVPFHLPEMIFKGEIKDYPGIGEWWIEKGIPYSAEEFYQQNKLLQVKSSG
jgi:hypothetical protein